VKLSVIIPAYNEGNGIVDCINETSEAMKLLNLDYEIIAVDDGSKDDTYKAAKAIEERNRSVRVFQNNPNMGKGYAIKEGFGHSTGDLVAFLDADLALSPSQLINFVPKMRYADVVIGSKRHPQSKIKYPLRRRFLSKGFNILARTMFGLPLNDTQCGFKLFRRQVLEEVLPNIAVKKYAFDVELLAEAQRRNFRIIEMPILLNHTHERLRVTDMFKMGIDLFAIFFRMEHPKLWHYLNNNKAFCAIAGLR
jgi:dolichol-phosphate mannosyltransferase